MMLELWLLLLDSSKAGLGLGLFVFNTRRQVLVWDSLEFVLDRMKLAVADKGQACPTEIIVIAVLLDQSHEGRFNYSPDTYISYRERCPCSDRMQCGGDGSRLCPPFASARPSCACGRGCGHEIAREHARP